MNIKKFLLSLVIISTSLGCITIETTEDKSTQDNTTQNTNSGHHSDHHHNDHH